MWSDLLLAVFLYTDIPPLPLIALQLWWILDLLKEDFGLESYREHVDPSNIVMIAFWAVLFFRKWKAFGKIATVTVLTRALSLQDWIQRCNHQRVVTYVLKQKGLAKGPLLFINLGLTSMQGTTRRDVKRLACWPISMRISARITTMASLKRKCDQSQRRLKGTGPFGPDRAYLLQTILDGSRRNPGLAVPNVEYEDAFINLPLYAPPDRKNGLAKWVRTYFLSIDRPQYQVLWICQAGDLDRPICWLEPPSQTSEIQTTLASLSLAGLWWLTLLDHLWRRSPLPHPILTANFTSRFDRSSKFIKERKYLKALLVWQAEIEARTFVPASFISGSVPNVV